jgi:hypothetical protein
MQGQALSHYRRRLFVAMAGALTTFTGAEAMVLAPQVHTLFTHGRLVSYSEIFLGQEEIPVPHVKHPTQVGHIPTHIIGMWDSWLGGTCLAHPVVPRKRRGTVSSLPILGTRALRQFMLI